MIRIERVILPDGLRALAHRDPNGDLTIYLSQTLDAGSQRAAVAEAVRALRRTGWRAGLPTAGIALLLALRSWAGRAGRVIAAHRMAWGVATAAVAGAAVAGLFVVSVPLPHAPAVSGRRPGAAPGAAMPPGPGQQAAPPPLGGSAQPTPAVQVSPEQVQPGHPPGTSGAGTTRSEPPAPGPTPPPTSAPSSPPARTGNGTCIGLLGIRLCLRL